MPNDLKKAGYATSEHIFGRDLVTAVYSESTDTSEQRIKEHIECTFGRIKK